MAQSTQEAEGEQQRRQAVLRERYLSFLQKSADKPATIEMCERTTVTATIKAFQPSSEHVIVGTVAVA
ncbi:Gem-associated protein 7 [Caenorhabditis elegans]|uniref:Gem-associated protein 7 n=1 Tax=Caenorhabditis elegans TaxID=6239 RepID=Q9XVD4_CAEEL|nr:Gem-associated protein 7 [Caenorhabditis elegans]CAB03910.1 Gem-associated protein 7 [Caenorhabditis elegans]|eukprot:NP_499524.1 Uncharacterized protein CELE_C24H11.5 [Caenorhabditis elegans]